MSYTPFTKQQLKDKVAKKLGILGNGESLSGEDSIALDDHIEAELRSLLEDNVINFDIEDSQSIEPDAFIPLASIIAFSITDEFNVPASSLGLLASNAEKGLSDLKRRATPQYKYTTLKTKYY